ncbi:unnamed protein product [Moneuplotes crassus]|uniref:Uncharacterized protein n=3 Tax=Euplotes crassus TaxID=5936 RepID=A0AAD1XTH4_EUPCR|nr:unnamed protein product [Moneuplotes crassus]
MSSSAANLNILIPPGPSSHHKASSGDYGYDKDFNAKQMHSSFLKHSSKTSSQDQNCDVLYKSTSDFEVHLVENDNKESESVAITETTTSKYRGRKYEPSPTSKISLRINKLKQYRSKQKLTSSSPYFMNKTYTPKRRFETKFKFGREDSPKEISKNSSIKKFALRNNKEIRNSKDSDFNIKNEMPKTTRGHTKNKLSYCNSKELRDIQQKLEHHRKISKDLEQVNRVSQSKYSISIKDQDPMPVRKNLHRRNNTKSFLAKYVTKGSKPSYLRDTAGSKTKRSMGREKAERIRQISKEKSLYKPVSKLYTIEEPDPQENLNDLIELADKFWENCELDTKVMKPPKRIKQTKIKKQVRTARPGLKQTQETVQGKPQRPQRAYEKIPVVTAQKSQKHLQKVQKIKPMQKGKLINNSIKKTSQIPKPSFSRNITGMKTPLLRDLKPVLKDPTVSIKEKARAKYEKKDYHYEFTVRDSTNRDDDISVPLQSDCGDEKGFPRLDPTDRKNIRSTIERGMGGISKHSNKNRRSRAERNSSRYGSSRMGSVDTNKIASSTCKMTPMNPNKSKPPEREESISHYDKDLFSDEESSKKLFHIENKGSDEKPIGKQKMQKYQIQSKKLRTDAKDNMKKRINSTTNLTNSFEYQFKRNNLENSSILKSNNEQSAYKSKKMFTTSSQTKILKSPASKEKVTQKYDANDSRIVTSFKPSSLNDDESWLYHARFTQEYSSESKQCTTPVISVSRLHKLNEVERKAIIKKAEILKEITKAKNKNSTYQHHTIRNLEKKNSNLSPKSPEDGLAKAKKKILEDEENQALFAANKLVSAQVAEYNKKLRFLTLQKTKKKQKQKKKEESEKSKISEKKRSQIIQDAEREYQSIYLMEDFKSYNRSCEEINVRFQTNSTAERRVPVMHNSRNKSQDTFGQKQGSKFKLTNNSIKHEELQEYLKDSSFGNREKISFDEDGL